MKTTQRNWIGRSEGALVDFQFADKNGSLRVFTTRPDTIFGVTYMVVAPEHELIPALTTAEQKTAVEEYVTYVKSRSEVDRMADKRVSGVFTGSYCKHPFTNENIPIWTSEYVLAGYGTGAIMAVPSDDERDMAFAKHFDIPIIEVVDKSKYPDATLADKIGVIINSDFLNGLEVKDAIAKANEVIEARGFGKAKVNFKLRDANMTRQRYWGEPMPIIYRPDGTTEALSADELPLLLPELADFKPTGDGTGPLSKLSDWVNLPDGSRRETDTMPGFAGSSWYFLRYMDAKNDTEFVSKEAVEYWQNVDFYLGGTEHATGHLLYSRMWNNFLYDLGYTPTAEPFQRLFNQGMIQGRALLLAVRNSDGTTRNLYVPIETANDKDQLTPSAWQTLKQDSRFADMDDANIDFMENGNIQLTIEITKMSKSKFNVVNPDDIVRDYGADCLRMFEMFLGPLEMSKPWDTKGIKGVEGFLRKFWTLFFDKETLTLTDTPATKDEQKVLHTCIKRMREDIERLSLNTCVSHFMIATNDLKKLNCNKREILIPMVQLLAPFAPFMCEELWSLLGNTTSIHTTHNYPVHNEAFLVEDAFEYAVQVNGKLRATILLSATETADDIQEKVVALPEVQKWLNGNPPKKVILVPKKLVNVVC